MSLVLFSCSDGYKLSIYNKNAGVAEINSQVDEEANAGLGRLRSALTYTTPDNFMYHAALFLVMKNRQKITMCDCFCLLLTY